jgi:hypothetical protein
MSFEVLFNRNILLFYIYSKGDKEVGLEKMTAAIASLISLDERNLSLEFKQS